MTYPISLNTLLLVALISLPALAMAQEQPTATDAPAPATDMGALYDLQRGEAGNPPLDEKLGRQLPADTSVLTMETGGQRFHALRQEAERAEPWGWILLLPDPGMGEAWTQQVEALRFDLARHGWLTLALEPPQPDLPTLPERSLPVMKSFSQASEPTANTPPSPASSGAVPASADDDTNPPAPFAERFNERIALALEQLPQQENQSHILLAFGRAASWSAAYITAHPELDASLILLDPLADTQPNAPMLSELWEPLGSTRVLDLYHAPLPGYPAAASAARIRKAQAQRAKMERYRQAKIAPPFTGWQPQMPWLTQTVRGVIKSQIVEPLEQARALEKYALPTEPNQTKPGTVR
ncbi:alpha/beta hydrolase family protein [Marinobacterium sp. D7]|uniref:DUF3530 family protein n=1 Tax=Marinobacterium ramblicola TaxID=2849041 RepID=UPI001C2DCA84|nr:DUF3530 family protein [Marinobacterium ramblicola]MBV1787323.1 alpha/beta hydrolase family protein [Marinobacterium ramblicola]